MPQEDEVPPSSQAPSDPKENKNGNSPTTTNNNNNKNESKKKKPEHNPRWKGYTLIMLSSLINLSSVSNISGNTDYRGSAAVCQTFSCFSFAFCLILLVLDRTQLCAEHFHFTQAWDGRLEGYTLVFLVLWWIVGVAYLTQVGGIAYLALNIYGSSWLCWAACLYTLNQWSDSKDILSIQELTGVSPTLKSWYVLWLASLVVTATSWNLYAMVQEENLNATAMGAAFGIASSILSFGFILVHYDFITCCSEGGWIELALSFVLCLMWVVGVAILTRHEAVGATMTGTGCTIDRLSFHDPNQDQHDSCLIQLADGTNLDCDEIHVQNVPGSNLYLSVWTCLLATVNIIFRWKAQQALQFAQAHHQRRKRGQDDDQEEKAEDDDEDNIDDFYDAANVY